MLNNTAEQRISFFHIKDRTLRFLLTQKGVLKNYFSWSAGFPSFAM